MESNVDRGEYAESGVVAVLSDVLVVDAGVVHPGYDRVPNTYTAQNAHRAKDVLVLTHTHTHTQIQTHPGVVTYLSFELLVNTIEVNWIKKKTIMYALI